MKILHLGIPWWKNGFHRGFTQLWDARRNGFWSHDSSFKNDDDGNREFRRILKSKNNIGFEAGNCCVCGKGV
jgi:hypothetical protein